MMINIDPSRPSPNFDSRDDASISLIVLHYTGMKSGGDALARLTDPTAKVSAHYLVEEDGHVFGLVDEQHRAWHAGVGAWLGVTDVNRISIGIEIVNPGHEWGYKEFPPPQVAAVMDIIREAQQRCGIGPEGVIGHSDLAPHRKDDPGELFPWGALSDAGLAIGQWSGSVPDDIPSGEDVFGLLTEIGYGVDAFGIASCLVAFQRRFCPQLLGQSFSPETRAAVGEIAARFRDARCV
ncbi:MAG: N-acetylmuramoyl-L-alanine amidase [Pseudomonadota bacterium]